MSPTTIRAAACETCTWRASGATSWTAGDAHAAQTGHTVRRSGGDPNETPKPYTEPHDAGPA